MKGFKQKQVRLLKYSPLMKILQFLGLQVLSGFATCSWTFEVAKYFDMILIIQSRSVNLYASKIENQCLEYNPLIEESWIQARSSK